MPAQEIGNFQLFTQVKNSFDKTNKLHTKVNLKVLLIKTKKTHQQQTEELLIHFVVIDVMDFRVC